uniref:Putative secreted protein n=1 Tax=Amblyomma cajennense TaxID=34607 RepID=A0A023FDA9_AMBCJ
MRHTWFLVLDLLTSGKHSRPGRLVEFEENVVRVISLKHILPSLINGPDDQACRSVELFSVIAYRHNSIFVLIVFVSITSIMFQFSPSGMGPAL